MKVLVIGSNGQIGQHVTELLQDSEKHEVQAMVRKEEQKDALKEKGIEAVLANLEGPVEDLTKVVKDVDAIVFTAGSGASTGDDKTLLIDLDGAIKAMKAAESAGVKRFVIVSAIQAHRPESFQEHPIRPYMVAKHYADEYLRQTNLDYTIIRPGGLTNNAGTGMVEVAKDVKMGEIPRRDVAKVIIAALENDNAVKKEFDLISGDTDIKQAINSL